MKLKGVILNPEIKGESLQNKTLHIAGVDLEYLKPMVELHKRKSLLYYKRHKLRRTLSKINTEELFNTMSQQNAFFTYKSKGALTNSH